MKKIVNVIFTLFFVTIVNAQVTTSARTTTFVIRNDKGLEYENKQLTLFYKFGYGNTDFKSCKGILFTPAPRETQSNLLEGFSLYINPDNWIYLPDLIKNAVAYKNLCSFMYMPKNGSSYITNNKEVILIKGDNGLVTIMIVAYDTENTILLRPN